VFNEFFETSHNLNAEYLAKMHAFNYHLICDEMNLDIKINAFLDDNSSKSLLEIKTPEKLNNKILLEYFKRLK
jgi:2-succinyl-5-enolpyruvyl-6-hydroxy-3-cyclohexene-1-carboxylate synthase